MQATAVPSGLPRTTYVKPQLTDAVVAAPVRSLG